MELGGPWLQRLEGLTASLRPRGGPHPGLLPGAAGGGC